MRAMSDVLRLKISEVVVAAAPAGSLEIQNVYDHLVEPPNLELGDLAFGCFHLAKVLKQSPAKLAQDLAAKIQAPELFESVQAAGPYLNFRLSLKQLGQSLVAEILSGDYFKRTLLQNAPRTMVEYSQPNTHKELHVGHMRNACLGNSVVRILRFAGVPVVASTFPGDVGTHVAKCLWYLKLHNTEAAPQEHKGEWLGRMYSKAHLKLEAEESIPALYEANKKILTSILQELEHKQGPYFELWKETRQWSLELMQEAYAWAGLEFDHWYWESEVDTASVEYVKSLFEKGLLQKSDGAIGLDLSSEGLGFCLLLKSDGTGLYATKDLELARRKFQDFKIDRSLYVVDMRQALHFKQVFRVLEILGFEQAQNCLHLQYNFVELPDGAMSSRKGNIVPLMQLVKKMEHMVLDQYLQRYTGEWSPEEQKLVATQVAQGAIKYGMLRQDNNKKIVFDMAEWLRLDGESGPFIQYSAARIQSLTRKLKTPNATTKDWDFDLLQHKAERSLLQGLMGFHPAVLMAAEQFRPSVICTYLYDLAKRYNVFYHECPVAQAETSALKETRLALSQSCGEVLKHGLDLLGIPTPERM